MTSNLPADFWLGVEQFNQREFYACHDTLEALWMEAAEPPKSLYQGILQMAVAFYHLGNGNWRGAVILLGEGMNRLRSYPSDYAGIDIDALLQQGRALLMELQQAGPEQVDDYAARLGLVQSDGADGELGRKSPASDLHLPQIRGVS